MRRGLPLAAVALIGVLWVLLYDEPSDPSAALEGSPPEVLDQEESTDSWQSESPGAARRPSEPVESELPTEEIGTASRVDDPVTRASLLGIPASFHSATAPDAEPERYQWVLAHRAWLVALRQDNLEDALETLATTESKYDRHSIMRTVAKMSISVLLSRKGQGTYVESGQPYSMSQPDADTWVFLMNYFLFEVHRSEFPEYGDLMDWRPSDEGYDDRVPDLLDATLKLAARALDA